MNKNKIEPNDEDTTYNYLADFDRAKIKIIAVLFVVAAISGVAGFICSILWK